MAPRSQNPVPEHPHGAALERLPQAQETHRTRHHLRIDRRSCAPLDADNFAGGCKALIDCLRQAGLIPDDDPASVEITFLQTRVQTRKEEGTEIEILPPTPPILHPTQS